MQFDKNINKYKITKQIKSLRRIYQVSDIAITEKEVIINIPYEYLLSNKEIIFPIISNDEELNIKEHVYIIDYKENEFINPLFSKNTGKIEKLIIKNTSINQSNIYILSKFFPISKIEFENVDFTSINELKLTCKESIFKNCKINNGTRLIINNSESHITNNKLFNVYDDIFIANDDEFKIVRNDNIEVIDFQKMNVTTLVSYFNAYNLADWNITCIIGVNFDVPKTKSIRYYDERIKLLYYMYFLENEIYLTIYDQSDIKDDNQAVRNEPQYILKINKQNDEFLFEYTVHKYKSTGLIRSYPATFKEIPSFNLNPEEYIYYFKKFINYLEENKDVFISQIDLTPIIDKAKSSISFEKECSEYDNLEIDVDDEKITLNNLDKLDIEEKIYLSIFLERLNKKELINLLDCNDIKKIIVCHEKQMEPDIKTNIEIIEKAQNKQLTITISQFPNNTNKYIIEDDINNNFYRLHIYKNNEGEEEPIIIEKKNLEILLYENNANLLEKLYTHLQQEDYLAENNNPQKKKVKKPPYN